MGRRRNPNATQAPGRQARPSGSNGADAALEAVRLQAQEAAAKRKADEDNARAAKEEAEKERQEHEKRDRIRNLIPEDPKDNASYVRGPAGFETVPRASAQPYESCRRWLYRPIWCFWGLTVVLGYLVFTVVCLCTPGHSMSLLEMVVGFWTNALAVTGINVWRLINDVRWLREHFPNSEPDARRTMLQDRGLVPVAIARRMAPILPSELPLCVYEFHTGPLADALCSGSWKAYWYYVFPSGWWESTRCPDFGNEWDDEDEDVRVMDAQGPVLCKRARLRRATWICAFHYESFLISHQLLNVLTTRYRTSPGGVSPATVYTYLTTCMSSLNIPADCASRVKADTFNLAMKMLE